jgi:hypothetical protein
MKITDHIQKDTKAIAIKNHSKNGLQQERKETKRILKQTR